MTTSPKDETDGTGNVQLPAEQYDTIVLDAAGDVLGVVGRPIHLVSIEGILREDGQLEVKAIINGGFAKGAGNQGVSEIREQVVLQLKKAISYLND